MITAVDTNILLDILIPDSSFQASSKEALEKALARGRLLIGEIVYAELAVHFPTTDLLRQFLKETGMALVSSIPQALEEAAARWNRYLKYKDRGLNCPNCGQAFPYRQRILADFLIGAQALVQAESLLTRDRGFYRTYFKELKLLP